MGEFSGRVEKRQEALMRDLMNTKNFDELVAVGLEYISLSSSLNTLRYNLTHPCDHFLVDVAPSFVLALLERSACKAHLVHFHSRLRNALLSCFFLFEPSLSGARRRHNVQHTIISADRRSWSGIKCQCAAWLSHPHIRHCVSLLMCKHLK